jgi:squalene-hopene/tetraprenyl-beta-curcumene cyclase
MPYYLRSRVSVLCLLVGVLLATAPAAYAQIEPVSLRPTVQRSLSYLEAGGVSWMRERGCASCHHVPFLLWSHQEAARRGFNVDPDRLENWTNWTLANSLARGQEGGGLDTMAQLLLGRDRQSSWRGKPSRHLKTVDPYETLWENLLARQRPDGSWPPEGQLPNRPEITTRWALLALASRDSPMAAEGQVAVAAGVGPQLATVLRRIESQLPAAREKALAWLRGAPPDPSTEGAALRLLVEAAFGDAAKTQEYRRALLQRQRVDGGWSYRENGAESDAFATGVALYALSRTASAEMLAPAVSRAVGYLLDAQQADGSWKVNTRNVREAPETRARRTDPIYAYWGTAWAVLGLLQTMPEGTAP